MAFGNAGSDQPISGVPPPGHAQYCVPKCTRPGVPCTVRGWTSQNHNCVPIFTLFVFLISCTSAAADDDPDSETVAIAFALTTAAGLATVLGALVVFNERAVQAANHKVLAGALALSAGVMIYVSFVEMFAEALHKFGESGCDELEAELYTVLSFFGGMALCKALDLVVHYIGGGDHHGETPHDRNSQCCEVVDDKKQSCNTVRKKAPEHGQACDLDSPGEGSAVARLEGGEAHLEMKEVATSAAAITPQGSGTPVIKGPSNQSKLKRMGWLTAAAVALHNFPEGLATFIGTLDDKSVGAGLAVAIAIHNIPEGIAVAMPIYYGTGSRSKAFMWALLSGLSEPLGALIGYLVLMDHFTDATFGVTFGIVAGMMVYISFGCLLPTAVKHDPTNKVVTPCLVVGMFVMALSIVLFKI